MRLVGAAALGLVLMGGVLVNAGAQVASRAGNDANALRFRPHSAEALAVASDRAFERDQFRVARSLSSRAIAEAPLDARSLRVFGISSIERGDAERGVKAMALAGALGWRDTPTQLWQAQMAVRGGAWNVAAERLDALARRRQVLGQAYRLMRAVALAPEGAEAMKVRLAARPAWRADFLGFMEPMTPELSRGHELLLEAIARGGSATMPSDAAPFVSMLLGQGEFARGGRLWARWIAPPGSAPAGQLQDGAFARTLQGDAPPSFAWTLRSVAGATIDAAGAGRGVRVSAGREASGTLADQLLVLAPGRYALAFDRQGNAGAGDSFVWRLWCRAEGGTSIPLDVKAVGAAGSWQRMRADFDVPATGCPAQVLSLAVRDSEAATDVTAAYNHVRVSRAGAGRG